MRVSVVIPAFNGQDLLSANLPAVMALGADEVIIVEDASTDGTRQFLRDHYPQIKVIAHTTNTRFPQAVNDGFAAATGEIVVLLNQDVRPDKGLIKAILPHFKYEHIAAVTFNEGERSWAKAKLVQGFLEYVNGELSKSAHISFWASGGSSAFRRSTWNLLGGFDVSYTPGYFEDTDLGYRAWKRGLEIIWEPNARVEHQVESTIKHAIASSFLQRAKDRNYLLTNWKNLDSKNLGSHIWSLLTRIIKSPGFLVPTLMALTHIGEVVIFRHRERQFTKLTDEQIFAKFS